MKTLLMTLNLIALSGVPAASASGPAPEASPAVLKPGDEIAARALLRLKGLVRRLDTAVYMEVDHRVVHRLLGDLPTHFARSASGARRPAEASLLGDLARSLQTKEMVLWRQRWLAGRPLTPMKPGTAGHPPRQTGGLDGPLGARAAGLAAEFEAFTADAERLLGVDLDSPEALGGASDSGMNWRPLDLRDSLNAKSSACDGPRGKIPAAAKRPAQATPEEPRSHRSRFGLDILDRFGGLLERSW